MAGGSSAETILVVDDESTVRQTFLGWLREANLGCNLLDAGDAEQALRLANQNTIDLAILDWNLGVGIDGLHLLEDLTVFNPDIVAIMVTGYANRATPLMAMRLGVRDYLDKNQDLTRDTFQAAVVRQLARIRPARRERRISAGLAAFSKAVEQALPVVQAAAQLNDPVPVSDAVRALSRLSRAVTGATDGALLVRAYDDSRQPAEQVAAYRLDGTQLPGDLVPFRESLAASALSMRQPCSVDNPELAGVPLQPFERGRKGLLLLPMDVAPGVQAVLELFDKPGGFNAADQRIGEELAAMGEGLLRQSLAARQSNNALAEALTQAARIRDEVGEGHKAPDVLEGVRQGLEHNPAAALAPDCTVRLAEAIRALAVRHGDTAVNHCLRLVEGLRELLDSVAGASA
jgi:ActR/RegA family two-component response regulator